MNTQPDFKEFLRLLEENSVEYVIVGGYAVAFHGYPRFTKDLDIFYNDTESNIKKIRQSLIEFGFQPESIPEEIFSPNAILNFGIEPVRIDLLNLHRQAPGCGGSGKAGGKIQLTLKSRRLVFMV
jgi:hypothetical protein